MYFQLRFMEGNDFVHTIIVSGTNTKESGNTEVN